MTTIKHSYANGNATIDLGVDGSRVISWPDGEELNLEYPLNVDVRLSERCAFGFNPSTNSAVCSFCHESARTDGSDGDLDQLYSKLSQLLPGTEIAMGVNQFTPEVLKLIDRLNDAKYVVNITVNQGHLKRDESVVNMLIQRNLINGLGVSFRNEFDYIPDIITSYPHTVLHVIIGIDDIDDVKQLADRYNIAKLLVLGEKNFGFNLGKVNTTAHRPWYHHIHELFSIFDVVSFDNLALRQLNIQRFLTKEKYKQFYQGEHSFYINATTKTFHPSSRSTDYVDWNSVSVSDYYTSLQSCQPVDFMI